VRIRKEIDTGVKLIDNGIVPDDVIGALVLGVYDGMGRVDHDISLDQVVVSPVFKGDEIAGASISRSLWATHTFQCVVKDPVVVGIAPVDMDTVVFVTALHITILNDIIGGSTVRKTQVSPAGIAPGIKDLEAVDFYKMSVSQVDGPVDVGDYDLMIFVSGVSDAVSGFSGPYWLYDLRVCSCQNIDRIAGHDCIIRFGYSPPGRGWRESVVRVVPVDSIHIIGVGSNEISEKKQKKYTEENGSFVH
jgi:hypothetical protein